MPHIAINTHNPFGLTLKEQLFVGHLLTAICSDKPIKPKECIKRVYSVKNDATARSMASEYLAKPNIHRAIQCGLKEAGLLVDSSKIAQRLSDGLHAVNSKGEVDYTTRLRYIQEICKLTGLYDMPVSNKAEYKPS